MGRGVWEGVVMGVGGVDRPASPASAPLGLSPPTTGRKPPTLGSDLENPPPIIVVMSSWDCRR